MKAGYCLALLVLAAASPTLAEHAPRNSRAAPVQKEAARTASPHNHLTKEQRMSTIVRMNPPTLPDFGQHGFSQISIAEPGRIAYISGQVAWTPEGAPVPDDLVDQMKVVGDNVRKAVAAVGATMHDVVSARFYVTDLTPERQERVMPPLRAIFDGAQPSLTGIGVAKLAGPGLQVELELIVRVPD